MLATTYNVLRRNKPFLVPLFFVDFTKETLIPRVARNYSITSGRASDATYTNDSGTVSTATSGNLRLTKTKGYFVEIQSTNLVLNNTDLTAWSDIGTPTHTANNVTCGDLSLGLLGDDDASGLEGKSQVISFTGNAQKSISFYVKKGTATSTVIRLRDTTAPADRLLVTITWSGTVPVVTYTTGSSEFTTEALASDVYRIRCLTTSVTAANTNQLEIYPATDAALATSATGDINIGGFQAEDAVKGTSLIFTTGATATRNADSLIYNVANIDNTKGTIYFELQSNWSGTAERATINVLGRNTGDSIFFSSGNITSTIKLHDGTSVAASNGFGDIAAGMVKRLVSFGSLGKTLAGAGVTYNIAAFDGNLGFAGIQIGAGGSGEEFGGWIKWIKIFNKEVSLSKAQTLTT